MTFRHPSFLRSIMCTVCLRVVTARYLNGLIAVSITMYAYGNEAGRNHVQSAKRFFFFLCNIRIKRVPTAHQTYGFNMYERMYIG